MINSDKNMNLHESGRSPNALGNATMFCERDIESIIKAIPYTWNIERDFDGKFYMYLKVEEHKLSSSGFDPDVLFKELLVQLRKIYAK